MAFEQELEEIRENLKGAKNKIIIISGKEVALFKKDGGIRLSQELKTPFLGRIPFDPELIEILDKGILKGNTSLHILNSHFLRSGNNYRSG